jgi:hypothetical protein
MFRVTLACGGIPNELAAQAARDIEKEFTEFRAPRYTNANCRFEDGKIVLSCDNDGWDDKGLNLMDEFSDCLCAYLPSFDGGIRLVSLTALDTK